ncbi:unnamed protein product [Orchesella dallaii]|uniref:Uncharacterized protein n=1 Tax=Orchesella dallaii TaxID=48710 RepID=A0ABP1Q3Y6_9HEXA
MVIIEPKDCPNWLYRFDEKNPPGPDEFFDNSFFYLLKNFGNPLTQIATLKHGMYFIQVSNSNPLLANRQAQNHVSLPILEMMDVIWQSHAVGVVNTPTKLILVLQQLPDKNVAKVETMHLGLCVDYIGRYKRVVERCDPAYNESCLTVAAFLRGQPQKTIEINLTTSNVAHYYQNEHCRPFFYVGKSKFDSTTLAYLTHFMSGRLNMEPIIMQIIVSNATLVNVHNMMIITTTYLPYLQYTYETHPIGGFALSVENNELHFITCAAAASKSTFLSLFGYISAFDASSWLAIWISAVVSLVVWRIVEKLENIQGLGPLMVYTVLLGQSSNHLNKARWLTGAWILTSIVISHNYQGENIERLTAPLSPKMIEDFSELLELNLTIYSATQLKETRLSQFVNGLPEGFSTEVLAGFYQFTLFGNVFLRKNLNISLELVYKKLFEVLYMPKNKTEATNLLKTGFYMNHLSTCGSNAFVGPLKRIHFFKQQLLERGIPNKRIATSKTPYADVTQTLFYHFDEKNQLTQEVPFHQNFLYLWTDYRNPLTTWRTMKHEMLFIQVSNSNSSLQVENQEPNLIPTFEMIDAVWQNGMFGIVNYPTKSIIVLQNTSKQHTAEVENIYLATCEELIGRYKRIVEMCGHKFDGSCLAIATFFLTSFITH